jgi:cytochrome oxidase assembly protein ShyY1
MGYAVQWFAMAVVLAGLCIWVAVERAPEGHHGC